MRHAALLLFALVLLPACSTDRVAQVADTKEAMAGTGLNLQEKQRLVDKIASEAATPAQRRESLKDIAWTAANGNAARTRAIDLLVDDPTDPGNADTRNMLVLLLHPEPDTAVVAHIAKLAADRGWTDLTPPLIRQLARVRIGTEDQDRDEWAALTKLHPGKPMEQIAFEVFALPDSQGLAGDRTNRAREAAWALLTRLDKDGSKRRSMLAGMAQSSSPAIADVRAAADELGAVPLTAGEVEWLRQLRKPANAPWWQQASAAVATLPSESRLGLMLRHAEPIRWSSVHQPAWLSASKSQLAGELARRLQGADTFSRSEEGSSGRRSELLTDNLSQMSWGDVLALLVLDRALSTPGMADRLWKQAMEDQADKTTEYGGALVPQATGAFNADLYTPRASQRFSDNRFVASDELLQAAATGLAVYHFHAQKNANAQYAGPSDGDIEYANTSGRLCIVFTPVRDGAFNVDAYFAGSIKCDMGTITRGQ